MQNAQPLMFAPFCLDLDNEQLWHGQDTCHLTRKAFAVLRYLVEHAGQLVTKEALLDTVWPETYVSDAALTVSIREIRQVLGDCARQPRFIETVHRRGYRFIAPMTTTGRLPVVSTAPGVPRLSPQSSVPNPVAVVDQGCEMSRLHQGLRQALQGERQIIFVTGEVGIGKTTLVDAFVAQLGITPPLLIGHGQCIDHHGAGEAYLPLLEAFGRLCREPHGTRLIEMLHHQAPSWLRQMPGLLPTASLEAFQRRASGSTRECMLRQLAEAVEVLTAERPLILVLEDLHWSDVSTLDWLACVARRREPARLLVLGTYRPVDVRVRAHPLHRIKHELQLHGQCDELALDYWSETAVASYVAQRFAARALPPGLVRVIHQRTNGNPLFVANVVDQVIRQGYLRQGPMGWTLQGSLTDMAGGVPENLRQLIEHQLAQADPGDHAILEAASVVGMEFSAAAVAAGVNQPLADVEARCEALARQGMFVQTRGTATWSDGTLTAHYGFTHALHHEVLYTRMSASQQMRLHQSIGPCLAAG